MTKPTPLIDSTAPPQLQKALDEARGALGREADVQRLRKKLGELGPAASSDVYGGGGAARASGLGAKVVTIAAAGVLLIAAAIAFVQRSPSELRAPAPQAAQPAVMPAPQADMNRPTPALPVAAAPAPAIELTTPEPTQPKAASARRKAPLAVATPDEPVALAPAKPKELELLVSAQDAIEASPQRALGLLDEHARIYPSGNFAIERESLAIDALRKLGRTTAAQTRARAFIARFPGSSNAKHLQRWLDESAGADHKPQAQPLPTR